MVPKHTSGFCPGRGTLFNLVGFSAGLRFSVIVLGWLLLFVLLPVLVLGPLESGFLKLFGKIVFALDFLPGSSLEMELTDWDATRATDKNVNKILLIV